ncbi:MAG: phosphoglycerate dehydrogenase, partial [Isosphaeraceae bacterium]
MPTVLIGSGPLRNRPGPYRDLLVDAGFTPIDVEGTHTLTEAELRAVLPGADAIVAGGEPLSAPLLALAPKLRVIARTGVGYDSVDVAAASARKIVVTITPGTNHDSVAEHTFALLLALTRRIVADDRIIHDGGWDRTMPRPLRGTTLGLIGLGRIGRAVALRAVAFDMRVIAFDPVADAPFDAHYGIDRVSMDELLARSDAVSLHLPLLETTRGLVNQAFLARMKPGALLLNTSRGGLIVEADLYQGLASGRLGGAGLDVTEPEPTRPDNPLLLAPNLIISPHIAGIDTRAMADMAELAARCIVDLFEGHWPTPCIVNPELGPDW